MGELADAGVLGYSDDGAPVRSPKLMRSALLYAGMLGLPVVEHAEDSDLTAGAEAHEGYVASVMGLAGWPAAAEVGAVSRDLAVLADALGDEPRARLHLTHVSTAAALDLVRRAKATGCRLPATSRPTTWPSRTSGSPARGAGPGRRSVPMASRAIRGRTRP
jgi:dihydroorotase